ncbi:hypothetical protein BJX65DRAFT_268330 [Aspergillus insuetus]
MALRDERDMDGTNLRTGTPSGPFLSRLKTPSLLLATCQSGSRPWLNNRIGQEMQRVSITALRTRLPSPKEPLLPATPSSLYCHFYIASNSLGKCISTSPANKASVPDPLRIRGMQPYSLLRLVSSTWLSEQWMKRYFRDLFLNLWRSPG